MAETSTRDRTDEALREREITFAALARVAPVGIMRFDADGRCNYVNDRWTALTGFTVDEAIGDGWKNAIHPEDRATVSDHWMRMRATNEVFREEYRLCRPDGGIKWALAEGVALRGYAREPLGFIRTVTDITRHRELEEELMLARADLEERVQERTADLEAEMRERQKLEKQVLEVKEGEQRRFSQDLHDGLGQYLTGALFHALALERDLAAEKSAFESTASRIAELVNQSISQAHDLARGIDPVPLRPDGLLSALEELVQQLSGAHSLHCSFECKDQVLIEDNAVATHLYRIAQEAMMNAIKHSKGSRVTACLEKLSTHSALVVSDDGIGLLRGDHQAGRGLNIIKHRARLIDADVCVESSPGAGTIVRCMFDCAHEVA